MAKKQQAQQKAVNENDKRLDVAQVAQRLGLSRSSIYRLIHSGELRAATFGPVRGYQVWEASVVEYEQRKLQEAGVEG